MDYTTDGNTVFAGKKAIATMVLGNDRYELVILQGMPREQMVLKIISDLTSFAAKEKLTVDYNPKLRGEQYFKKLDR